MDEMILVVGSTGLLGSEIVTKARSSGLPVRALARPTASPQRLEQLATARAEVVWGDLKDPSSLARACQGVSAVISTASSTLSHQPGDDIGSVDRDGQIALVEAARSAGVRHFTFFGLGLRYGDSPLIASKQAFEQSVRSSGMQWTSLEGSYFMEVWLSPSLGFDYGNKKAVYFGSGNGKNWWVSYRDLAEPAVNAHRTPAAWEKTFDACGPEALTQREVVARFEAASGGKFETQEIPESELAAQAENAEHPLQKTFAALQLACARGVPMDPEPFARTFGLTLTTMDNYIRNVTGTAGRVR
jgi:uncharacterized protein YbjT (DUF2867 family)